MVTTSHLNVFSYLISDDNKLFYDSISFSIEEDDECIILNRYLFKRTKLVNFLNNKNNECLSNGDITFKPIIFKREYFQKIETRLISKIQSDKPYVDGTSSINYNNYRQCLDNIYYNLHSKKIEQYCDLNEIFNNVIEQIEWATLKNTYHLYSYGNE